MPRSQNYIQLVLTFGHLNLCQIGIEHSFVKTRMVSTKKDRSFKRFFTSQQ